MEMSIPADVQARLLEADRAYREARGRLIDVLADAWTGQLDLKLQEHGGAAEAVSYDVALETTNWLRPATVHPRTADGRVVDSRLASDLAADLPVLHRWVAMVSSEECGGHHPCTYPANRRQAAGG